VTDPMTAMAVGYGGAVLVAAGLAGLWWVARTARRAHQRAATGLVRLPSGRHIQIRPRPYDWKERGL
jgi:protein-S-isoprenylcysteine O-methyltransferase Ste14